MKKNYQNIFDKIIGGFPEFDLGGVDIQVWEAGFCSTLLLQP